MPRVLAAGKTDPGLKRKTNEDAFRIYTASDPSAATRGFLFAVADGIGSYRAGGQASTMAVDQLALYFQYPDSRFAGSRTLEELIFRANEVITILRTRQKEYYGMGSTLTALLIDSNASRGVVFQAGDSMAYLARGGDLAPITTAQKAEGSALANHLGLGDKFKLEKVGILFEPGDAVLLCSDGIHGALTKEQLMEGVTLSPDPNVCVDHLVAQAVQRGDDNATAIVVKLLP
jgi:protein phosphatase